jgi:spermidine/putrescine transport system substrate-binding protein
MMVTYQRAIARTLIVLFWLTLTMLFLFSGQVVDLFKSKRSISILAWPTNLSADFVSAFEQKTGIKVYITYFETNEELFVKIKSGQGKGYDLIMASDYVTDLLLKEGAVKKIDKSRLNFWKDLYPTLLGHPFDQNNDYTIPYVWSLYGLAVDTNQFGGKLPSDSWSLAFDPAQKERSIGMLEDARELAAIAMLYYFGKVGNLSHEEWYKLSALLRAQKKYVAIYSDLRADYLLLSKTCSVVISNNADVTNALRKDKNMTFIVPKEGSFWVIDSFAIPRSTDRDEFVYQFLNYLYQPEILSKYANKHGFMSPIQSVSIEAEQYGIPFTEPTPELVSRLRFFPSSIPRQKLDALWIGLKG